MKYKYITNNTGGYNIVLDLERPNVVFATAYNKEDAGNICTALNNHNELRLAVIAAQQLIGEMVESNPDDSRIYDGYYASYQHQFREAIWRVEGKII